MVDLHPEHARAVLADLAVGIVVLDDRERVVWANAHAEDLLGAPCCALIGERAGALRLPHAPPPAEGAAPVVRVQGPLVGLSQRYVHGTGVGTLVMLYERGHALVGFLDALVSGAAGGIAACGVLNRAAIQGRLEGEISRSRRYANPLSVMTLHLAEEAPDAAARLAELARILKDQLRWVDLLGQWQDDVLVVVLPETGGEAANRLADKLEGPLSQVSPPAVPGVAAWRRGDNAERLVRRALVTPRPASESLASGRRG